MYAGSSSESQSESIKNMKHKASITILSRTKQLSCVHLLLTVATICKRLQPLTFWFPSQSTADTFYWVPNPNFISYHFLFIKWKAAF
jgi:hypothetical protein